MIFWCVNSYCSQEECQTEETSAASLSGQVIVTGESLNIKASSTSGALHIESEAPKEINASTVSGALTVSLPGSTGFKADVHCTSGGLTLEFDGKKNTTARSGEYLFGDGSTDITVTSLSGAIQISNASEEDEI